MAKYLIRSVRKPPRQVADRKSPSENKFIPMKRGIAPSIQERYKWRCKDIRLSIAKAANRQTWSEMLAIRLPSRGHGVTCFVCAQRIRALFYASSRITRSRVSPMNRVIYIHRENVHVLDKGNRRERRLKRND